MSHKPYPPRVRREDGELPTVNPATDRTLSYTDDTEEDGMELVGGSVRKPDPVFMEREGEFRVNRDEARI